MANPQRDYVALEAKGEEIERLFNQADEEFDGDMPEDMRERVKQLNREREDLAKRIADAKEFEELRIANRQQLEIARQPTGPFLHPNGSVNGHGNGQLKAAAPATAKGLAGAFLESPEWKSYFASIAPAGQVSDKTRVQSPAVLLNLGVKTLITGAGATSGGAFTIPDQSGIYEPLGRRPLMIRDLVSVRTTTSDMVEYVRMLTRENLAAPVAEATATTGASGTKPEGGMTFDRVSTPVETIAEWVAATKRSLSDAGQLQGIINDELRADLEEELEDQMLNGNGASPNLTGLANTSGTQTQAWATDILTTTRKGRTLVQTVGRAIPTAYVLNPTDWETIDLLQDNEARYYYGGPMDVGTPRLWGLRIVESEAQPAGAGWVGDWRKAVLWDREQAMISMSDSHDDFFTRNLVAILGELRAAWGIIRPQAFVELDLTA